MSARKSSVVTTFSIEDGPVVKGYTFDRVRVDTVVLSEFFGERQDTLTASGFAVKANGEQDKRYSSRVSVSVGELPDSLLEEIRAVNAR